MRRLLLFLSVILPLVTMAQEVGEMGAIMRVLGVSDPEDMDSYEFERLSEYLHDPLAINRASVSALERSGLLTSYQIASLTDYRTRHGGVFSFTELASIDGFGEGTVKALRPFLSLAVGNSADAPLRHELTLKGGYKANDGSTMMYGTKYRLTSGKINAGVSVSRPYDAASCYPSYVSGNLSWIHDCGKVVIGDFNARFGQGLCLWNSAVFSGLALPSAYMRKPAGLSSANSFTGSTALTGFAADLHKERWKLSAMLALPGLKEGNVSVLSPAFNLSRYTSFGQISVTHTMTFTEIFSNAFRIPQMKSSADASLCIRGMNVFAETAFDWVNKSVAFVGGVDFMALEWLRVAFLLKFLPSEGFSNDYGVATSGEVSMGDLKGNFSCEGSYFPKPKSKDVDMCWQLKSQTEWIYTFADKFMMEIRLKERFRTWGPAFRTDVRTGLKYMTESLSVSARFNALMCKNLGLSGYADVGYKHGAISAYLRLGAFKIDDWDDRIYVYERDAPGNFNVPAYYGRGLWVSSYLSCSLRRCLKIYLRASYVSYLLMPVEKRKPGKAELKLQCVFKI